MSREVDKIQERIRELSAMPTVPPHNRIQIEALRWVLTEVFGVTPWIVELPTVYIETAKKKGNKL